MKKKPFKRNQRENSAVDYKERAINFSQMVPPHFWEPLSWNFSGLFRILGHKEHFWFSQKKS